MRRTGAGVGFSGDGGGDRGGEIQGVVAPDVHTGERMPNVEQDFRSIPKSFAAATIAPSHRAAPVMERDSRPGERPPWLEEFLWDTSTPGWRDIKPKLPRAARGRTPREAASGEHHSNTHEEAALQPVASAVLNGMHAPLPRRLKPGLPGRTYEHAYEQPGAMSRTDAPAENWAERNAWALGGSFLDAAAGPWAEYRPPLPTLVSENKVFVPLPLYRIEIAKLLRQTRVEKGKTEEMDAETRKKVAAHHSARLEAEQRKAAAGKDLLSRRLMQRGVALELRVAMLKVNAAKRQQRNQRQEELRWQRYAHLASPLTSPRQPQTSPRHHRAAPTASPRHHRAAPALGGGGTGGVGVGGGSSMGGSARGGAGAGAEPQQLQPAQPAAAAGGACSTASNTPAEPPMKAGLGGAGGPAARLGLGAYPAYGPANLVWHLTNMDEPFLEPPGLGALDQARLGSIVEPLLSADLGALALAHLASLGETIEADL